MLLLGQKLQRQLSPPTIQEFDSWDDEKINNEVIQGDEKLLLKMIFLERSALKLIE